jgi:hypothetical protein
MVVQGQGIDILNMDHRTVTQGHTSLILLHLQSPIHQKGHLKERMCNAICAIPRICGSLRKDSLNVTIAGMFFTYLRDTAGEEADRL